MGGGNAVFDSLTELIWFVPDSPPVRQPQARQICEMMGGMVPSVEALSSLLTFNSGLRLPAPGYWLDYDGESFGNSDYSVWANDAAPLGVAWRMDLSIGRAHPVNDNQMHQVVCLGIDGAPEDDPEPDAPAPADAGVPDQGIGAVDFGMP